MFYTKNPLLKVVQWLWAAGLDHVSEHTKNFIKNACSSVADDRLYVITMLWHLY